MAVFTYTAKRSLISGHTAETSYSIETAAALMRPKKDYFRKETKTLDGTVEALLHRYSKVYEIRTGLITASEQLQYEEFFDSVAAGEAWTLDPTGTILSPGTTYSVVLEGAPPDGPEVASLVPYYRYSFQARVA